MGLDAAVLVYCDGGSIDLAGPGASGIDGVPALLFPKTRFADAGAVTLPELGIPPRHSFAVGSFTGCVLLVTRDAHLYNPSKLAARYLRPSLGHTVRLLTQRSVNDMTAYARWESGVLVRSLSVNPIGGVWESVGDPESFEVPFWSGSHPAEPGYPLPFHPLDLAQAAFQDVLRLSLEGLDDPDLVDACDVRLRLYHRA